MERYGVDQESLDVVHRESARMSRMVNDLLMLTRAEFGEVEVEFETVNLDVLALEVYEQILVIAKNRQLSIVLERIEPVRIEGSADRLRQLMLNLLNNAVKFTTDGGRIAISVYPLGQQAVLEVSDTGVGIAEKDLQHIFDRFYQVDTARTHHDEADGAGLGLSIARWIVDIHKGEIDVYSKVGKGTRFKIRLPKTQTSERKRVMWTAEPEHEMTKTHSNGS
jgi:signal transduction histidine kinase